MDLSMISIAKDTSIEPEVRIALINAIASITVTDMHMSAQKEELKDEASK